RRLDAHGIQEVDVGARADVRARGEQRRARGWAVCQRCVSHVRWAAQELLSVYEFGGGTAIDSRIRDARVLPRVARGEREAAPGARLRAHLEAVRRRGGEVEVVRQRRVRRRAVVLDDVSKALGEIRG